VGVSSGFPAWQKASWILEGYRQKKRAFSELESCRWYVEVAMNRRAQWRPVRAVCNDLQQSCQVAQCSSGQRKMCQKAEFMMNALLQRQLMKIPVHCSRYVIAWPEAQARNFTIEFSIKPIHLSEMALCCFSTETCEQAVLDVKRLTPGA
jgi:hypothetical protein